MLRNEIMVSVHDDDDHDDDEKCTNFSPRRWGKVSPFKNHGGFLPTSLLHPYQPIVGARFGWTIRVQGKSGHLSCVEETWTS